MKNSSRAYYTIVVLILSYIVIGIIAGCATTPKPLIDTIDVVDLYMAQQGKDTEIVVNALVEAAKVEQQRFYMDKLVMAERSIKDDPTLANTPEGIDEYKKVLAVILGEIKKGADYYDTLKSSIMEQVISKQLRGQALLAKVKKFEMERGVDEKTFQALIDQISDTSIEALKIHQKSIADKKAAQEAKLDGIVSSMNDNTLSTLYNMYKVVK